MLLKLAWRNLWRQKRRTILTSSALVLALFLSLLTRTLQEGTYAANIENSARFYTGLIQIQHPEYEDSLSIDDVIAQKGETFQIIKKHANVKTVLPRIESFALAAAGDKSKGVMVLGVQPYEENRYSGISKKLVKGEFLSANDRQILIGEGVANYFGLDVGDEMVLYGQGYRGQTAAGLYPVKGILKYPLPQLDNQLVYLPLSLAQELYSTGENITAWVLHTEDLKELDNTVSELRQRFDKALNVRDWESLAPEMAQQIMMDKAGGVFMIYVLYGVVGFGLFATIMMMTLERQREFAVMLATGLLRSRLVFLVVIESAFIAVIGVVIGMLVSAPVLAYLYFNPIRFTGETAQMMLDSGFEPIMPVSLAPLLFFEQIYAVLFILLLCLIYPLIRIYRLNLVSALKGGAHAR
ncbi:ABC transporter permease [Vibrio sp. JC009]|uniref:ABC transporter permease n=1 Tax=Vibrio sp. JC009 TaxID=2912314 RepID=UPI0023AFD4B1|nr:FtsX-like permease family protein [Vibrio sp. JC009]WED24191.1 ABC transporter permease [Vibrio sp. JC009]